MASVVCIREGPYYGGLLKRKCGRILFGPCGLSVIERCPYYRGRVCMEFGLFRTMWTVCNREVSVL